MNLMEPEKTFIQGILQIAVGCYHLTNSNAKGSMILVGEGIKRLKDYRPEFETVDVSTLVQTSAEFLATLQSLDQAAILAAAEWIQTHPAMDEPWSAPTGETLSLPTLRQAPPNL